MNPKHEYIHKWFGLSYANYLVIPRTLLQSCSETTQKKLVDALDAIYREESKNMPNNWPVNAQIRVQLRDNTTGRFIKDEMADYQRGRRKLW